MSPKRRLKTSPDEAPAKPAFQSLRLLGETARDFSASPYVNPRWLQWPMMNTDRARERYQICSVTARRG